jgi:hypothetical protein
MSKPLAFLLMLAIVLVIYFIALSVHFRKNRASILSSFGNERNFWLAAIFPLGDKSQSLKNYPQIGQIRNIGLRCQLLIFVLFIFLIAT